MMLPLNSYKFFLVLLIPTKGEKGTNQEYCKKQSENYFSRPFIALACRLFFLLVLVGGLFLFVLWTCILGFKGLFFCCRNLLVRYQYSQFLSTIWTDRSGSKHIVYRDFKLLSAPFTSYLIEHFYFLANLILLF